METSSSKQRSHEDYIARANRRADLHTQGVKGMFILNGGGILALLTFLTKLILNEPQPEYDLLALAKYVTGALACLSAGLIALAPINHFRYEASRFHDKPGTKELGKKYGRWHRNLFWFSLFLFFAGVTIALTGILRTLGHW